ncbi:non-ribosomal peptide synthetase, partial [Aphanothece hegewaldii CCALA 016]
RLFNTYGPTETTVVATQYEITSSIDINTVLIGKPLNNVQTYILDQYLQPVPVGVLGELHIGGRQLARGYLNRPQLTQEKFIPNPFSNDPLVKLYKTGDLARYLSDGNIEYVGRIDNQIKLRGFRIELGEIESILIQHPEIQNAVVIMRETASGDKQLVAYLVAPEQPINNIRAFLQEKLPPYIIPQNFVFLESFPLSFNGKLDRKALPTPDNLNRNSSNFIAPRDLLEQQLSIMWSEVLELNSIGIRDNFFEIGGHSLLAVQLMSLIKQQFGQNLPLATLFQYPTIEQLASLLRQEANLSLHSPLVSIQPKGTKPPLFFVHPVGGMVLCYFDLAQQLGTEQPFYGLQAGNLDKMNSVEEMAQYYLEAIQTVQPQSPYLIGGWSFGGLVAYEIAQQLQKQGETVSFLGLIDTHIPDDEPLNLEHPLNLLADLFNIERPEIEPEYVNLSQEEQLIYAFEIAQKTNLIPDDFDLEQAQYLWQVYQKNVMALNAYKPQSYTGQITLFQATENTLAQEIQNNLEKWSELTTNEINNYLLSGTHYTIVRPPFVADLALCLIQCLTNLTP